MVRSTTGFDRRRKKTREGILAAPIDLFQPKGVQVTNVEQSYVFAEAWARTFFDHFESRQELHDTITQERDKDTAPMFRSLANAPLPFTLSIEPVLTGIAGSTPSQLTNQPCSAIGLAYGSHNVEREFE